MAINPLKTAVLPKALSIKNLIGPSFIVLGLGLGSGEVILWPSLSSKYGMGIIWGAIVGITFQFFMNMEIERYALAHGESVFVGLARKFRLLSFWFLISTFVPWVWPGIAASSAKIFTNLLGINGAQSHYFAIALLVLIGALLTLGPVLYKTVENFQKALIALGVPSVFIITVLLARAEHWEALALGSIGIGNGFSFLPVGIPIASFLAALAYAGAGGNLNLAQSFYIKEKGYGMGKYAGKINSLLTGNKADQELSITGHKFEVTEQSLNDFKKWWKNINVEHFLIFWLTGTITITLLSLLAYITTHSVGTQLKDIDFVLQEGRVIGQMLFPAAGVFFLIVVGLTLFGTQLTVLDATSRILSENLILGFEKITEKHIAPTYYIVLWVQIIFGILIFLAGFTQPLELLTFSAVLNAFAMFIHVGLTLWLNLTELDKALRPAVWRICVMCLALFFYGGFSVYTIWEKFLS
jgi:hypothetical protein